MKIFNYFHLEENNTNFKTEVYSGISVFLALLPTLIINSVILSEAGMNSFGVYIATALTAGILTILIGVFTNSPYAMISGIGINTFFVYTSVYVFQDWRFSILSTIVFGIIYFLITILHYGKKLFTEFPENLKQALVIGIGIFILENGLEDIGVIAYYPHIITFFNIPFEISFIGLNTIHALFSPINLIVILGIALILILMKYEIKTAFIIGMLFIYIITIILELAGFHLTDYTVIPNEIIKLGITTHLNQVFFKLPDLTKLYNVDFLVNFILATIMMYFIVFFDILSTTMALTTKSGKEIDNINAFSHICSLGQILGGIIGTSPNIVAIENYVGILNGCKTGLTSVIIGLMFLISVFFSPFVFSIPVFVITPVFFVVSYLMIKDITKISREISELIPSLVIILIILATGSLINGLMFGVIAYVLVKLIFKKKEDITKITWALFVIFIILFVLNSFF